jgi:polyferredoxin
MYLFDYVFYRISRIYLKTKIETHRPDIFASGVVTLFQSFNLFTLLYFFFSIKTYPELCAYIIIPLMVLNWIFFFNRKNLKKNQKRWDGEEKNKRIMKGILIIAYLIVSIFFFGLALSKMW